MAVLDDPGREFVTTELVRLELLPKAVFNQRHDECMFYEEFLSLARMVPVDAGLLEAAYAHGCKHGLSAFDATHVAAAITSGCAELWTTEKPTKPMFRTTDVVIRTTYRE